MKVKLKKEQFVKVLSRIQNIVGKKSTMPILANVLLEANDKKLIVSATDLEVSLRSELEAEVGNPGKVCINARSFFEVVKELPTSDLSLTSEKEGPLQVESGKAHFQILTVSADEFPQLPDSETAQAASLPAQGLSEMIGKIYYAMSHDEMRYNLNGVYLETQAEGGKKGIRMVATDGHRLSMIDRKFEGDKPLQLKKGVILPRKGVMEMRGLLEGFNGDVKLSVQETNAVLALPQNTLYMRLVSGDYPNYKQVVPEDNDKRMVASKAELFGSLKRVSILSAGKTKCVKFDVRTGNAELSCSNPELGDAREELSVNYEGDPLSVGYNARYFMEVLDVAASDKVKLEMKTELSPGLISFDDDPNFVAAIMPMRI